MPWNRTLCAILSDKFLGEISKPNDHPIYFLCSGSYLSVNCRRRALNGIVNRGLRETCPVKVQRPALGSSRWSPKSTAPQAQSVFFHGKTASRVHVPACRASSELPFPGFPGAILLYSYARWPHRVWGSHHVRTLSLYKSGPPFCCYPVFKPVASLLLNRTPPFHPSRGDPLGHLSRSLTLMFTMYKLTWILFTFFALSLSVLTAPVPVPDGGEDLEARTTHNGRVRIHASILPHLSPTLWSPGNLVSTWFG